MEKIKNIFDYASKELSQDAFLIWLFENWNCEQEDVRLTSHSLLRSFLSFDDKQEFTIKKLSTRAQYKKIDIIIDCIINDKKYVIAIEDKTTSEEHNQLEGYRKIVENDFKDYNKKYIFYKPFLVNEGEHERVFNAKWDKYDINRIYDVFSKLDFPVKNYLLIEYIDHIKRLQSELVGALPEDINIWKINHWYNFASRQDWKLKDIHVAVGNFQNLYLWIQFRLKGTDEVFPYLEIRSRDFNDDNGNSAFIIRILIYGINDVIINENLDKWKSNINKSEIFMVNNYPKQIGINIVQKPVANSAELDQLLKVYINEYRRIMS